MTPADFLLIDIGNTAMKLRLANESALIGRTRRLATADLLGSDGAATLEKMLSDWKFGRVVLSSVVPSAAEILRARIAGTLTIDAKTDTGVDLRAYPGARTLGADRIANMAGALALFEDVGGVPLIVVDFGTAATFNVLDARGRFLGGVIAPGLASMSGYLPGRAAQLPRVRIGGRRPSAVGGSTREAMQAGVVFGYRGLIKEILAALREEFPAGRRAGVRVIATGGDASSLLKNGMARFDMIDEDLTLQGLRVIASRQAR